MNAEVPDENSNEHMILSPPEGFGIKMSNGKRSSSSSTGSAFAPKTNSLVDKKK